MLSVSKARLARRIRTHNPPAAAGPSSTRARGPRVPERSESESESDTSSDGSIQGSRGEREAKRARRSGEGGWSREAVGDRNSSSNEGRIEASSSESSSSSSEEEEEECECSSCKRSQCEEAVRCLDTGKVQKVRHDDKEPGVAETTWWVLEKGDPDTECKGRSRANGPAFQRWMGRLTQRTTRDPVGVLTGEARSSGVLPDGVVYVWMGQGETAMGKRAVPPAEGGFLAELQTEDTVPMVAVSPTDATRARAGGARRATRVLSSRADLNLLVDAFIPALITCSAGASSQPTLEGGVGWGTCNVPGTTLAPSFLGAACPELGEAARCTAIRDSAYTTGAFDGASKVQGAAALMQNTYTGDPMVVFRLSPRVAGVPIVVTKKRPNCHKAATCKRVFMGYVPGDECFASDFSYGRDVKQLVRETGAWVDLSLSDWCSGLMVQEMGEAAEAFLASVPVLNTEMVIRDGQILRQGLCVPFRVLVVHLVVWMESASNPLTVDECIHKLIRGLVSDLAECAPVDLAAISDAWTMGELCEETVAVQADPRPDLVKKTLSPLPDYSVSPR